MLKYFVFNTVSFLIYYKSNEFILRQLIAHHIREDGGYTNVHFICKRQVLAFQNQWFHWINVQWRKSFLSVRGDIWPRHLRSSAYGSRWKVKVDGNWPRLETTLIHEPRSATSDVHFPLLAITSALFKVQGSRFTKLI